MDLATTKDAATAGAGFDTVRIIGDIDALAEKHAGHADVFRSAVSRLLKVELAKVRDAAQARLLRDRHGRRCAEWLCFVQDEIIRLSFSAATRHLYHSPIPSDGERMAVVATGAG